MTNLVSLRIYSNQLTGSLPAELGRLTNLLGFHLDDVHLEIKDDRVVGGVPAGLESVCFKDGREEVMGSGVCRWDRQ